MRDRVKRTEFAPIEKDSFASCAPVELNGAWALESNHRLIAFVAVGRVFWRLGRIGFRAALNRGAKIEFVDGFSLTAFEENSCARTAASYRHVHVAFDNKLGGAARAFHDSSLRQNWVRLCLARPSRTRLTTPTMWPFSWPFGFATSTSRRPLQLKLRIASGLSR